MQPFLSSNVLQRPYNSRASMAQDERTMNNCCTLAFTPSQIQTCKNTAPNKKNSLLVGMSDDPDLHHCEMNADTLKVFFEYFPNGTPVTLDVAKGLGYLDFKHDYQLSQRDTKKTRAKWCTGQLQTNQYSLCGLRIAGLVYAISDCLSLSLFIYAHP